MAYIIPTVLERSKHGEVSYDLYSRLLKDRIIFINGEINMDSANIILAQLLYLEKKGPKEDVSIYINSHGGAVMAGFAIHDTMRHLSCDVRTTVTGMALSMGAFILSAGTKGKRFALLNSTILIHQPLLTISDTLQTSDLEIQTSESVRVKKLLNKYLSKYTGRTVSQIEKDSDRDKWMSAKEAKDYGIIDKVLSVS